MHKFIVEARGRKLVTTDPTKQDFLDRLLDDYENRKITISVAIEIPQKNVNAEQERLYRAFIVKAADHFGNDFHEMENILNSFKPMDMQGFHPLHTPKPVSKWTSAELDNFISKATAHLAQFGFHF